MMLSMKSHQFCYLFNFKVVHWHWCILKSFCHIWVHSHSSLIFQVQWCEIFRLCRHFLKIHMYVDHRKGVKKIHQQSVLLLPLISFKRKPLERCLTCCKIRAFGLLTCWIWLCLKLQDNLECEDKLLMLGCCITARWLGLFLAYQAVGVHR